jgi:hypothetical protein
LVSVPYALKASDAETLGGKPASAYLLDPNALNEPGSGGTTSPVSLPNPKALKPHSNSRSMNYIPYFTDNNNDLGNSLLYQSGGNVGIGTTTPGSQLDVAGYINFSDALRYQGTPVLQVPGGTSSYNTAVGLSRLPVNTTGAGNTATGNHALWANTTGSFNTAIGVNALYSNTTGTYNIAIGQSALYSTLPGGKSSP